MLREEIEDIRCFFRQIEKISLDAQKFFYICRKIKTVLSIADR